VFRYLLADLARWLFRRRHQAERCNGLFGTQLGWIPCSKRRNHCGRCLP
jgi:hypothetical protein